MIALDLDDDASSDKTMSAMELDDDDASWGDGCNGALTMAAMEIDDADDELRCGCGNETVAAMELLSSRMTMRTVVMAAEYR